MFIGGVVFFFLIKSIGQRIYCSSLLEKQHYSIKFYEYQLDQLIRGCQWHHGPRVVRLGAEGGTGPFSSETYSPP